MTPEFAPRIGLSTVILSFNEEANIRNAIESVKLLSDDVWVIDSESTDRTVQIAESLGAKVIVRPWPGYAAQWNYALREIPYRHPYVMIHASDEQIPVEWARELKEQLDAPNPPDMVLTAFRFWWMGRPVVHGGYGKTFIVKVGRREHMRYVPRSVNEHIEVKGNAYYMKARYEHRDAKEVERWLEKHLKYARLEAAERIKSRATSRRAGRAFGGSQADRVLWLRTRVYDRLPPFVRPFLYFTYRYVLGAGWRDGVTGTYFHVLHGFFYPMLIDVFEHEASGQERAT